MLTQGLARLTLFCYLALLTTGLAACGEPVSPSDGTTPPTTSAAVAIEASPVAAPTIPSVELIIFAAASLSEAFTEIGQLFKIEHPEATVTFNFGGSQELAAQLTEGAPGDVFASANATQLERTVEAGRVVTGTQSTFTRNQLVIIFPADNPGGIATLQDLAQPGLLLVLAAEEVPVGRYTLEFLELASADPELGATYKDDVLANVQSYEDSVRAVLTKVELGEADAGIVYTSDVATLPTTNVGQLAIPAPLNTAARYPIAPISDSPNPELAQAFIDLVLSPTGQGILVRYGFTPLE